MKRLEDRIGKLKPINEYSNEDLKASKVSDDILKVFEKWNEQEIVSKREINKETKSQLKEEMAKIRALKREFGTTQKWIKKMKTSKDKMALVILVSDWHVGKVVKDQADNIIYNTEIAINLLVDSYAKGIASYISNNNLAPRIDEVVILFLGDLVDNEIIYDTQLHKIDSPVGRQKMVATRGIIKFIDAIEQVFKTLTKHTINIRIEGIKGNHGRVQKGSLEVTSWDILIYDSLDLMFGALEKKNIAVDYTWDNYKKIQVKGHTGLLRHQAPPQAETSAGRNKYGGWQEIFGYDFLCHGHYHHWGINTYNSKIIFRNGSFIGMDDLSVELGARDRRSQLIFGVSKDSMPAFMQNINL